MVLHFYEEPPIPVLITKFTYLVKLRFQFHQKIRTWKPTIHSSSSYSKQWIPPVPVRKIRPDSGSVSTSGTLTCLGIGVVGALFTQSLLCLGIWKNVFAYTSRRPKQPWSVPPLSFGKLVMTQLWMDGWMNPNSVDVRFQLGSLSCKAQSVSRLDKLDAH